MLLSSIPWVDAEITPAGLLDFVSIRLAYPETENVAHFVSERAYYQKF